MYVNTPILNLFPGYSDSEEVSGRCSAIKDFSNSQDNGIKKIPVVNVCKTL